MNPLQSIDLNLLVALDALLREQSVTNAARSLGLSQPTLSASLARLRRHFGDPLLARDGNRLVLTPFGLRLRGQVEVAIGEASKVFASRVRFDPAACRREFRVVVSDYGGVIGVPEWSRRLTAAAPGATIRTVHISNEFVNGVPETLRKVDALILPHGVVSNLPHRDLYEDRWVCIAAEDNPRIGEQLSLEDLGELPWVMPFDSSGAFAPIVNELRARNIEIRAQAVAQTFVSVPALVEGTDRIALLQGRLAERMANQWGLRILDLPVEAAPVVQALWWHPALEDDVEHRWFRGLPEGLPERS